MTMTLRHSLVPLGLALVLGAAAAPPSSHFDRAAWKADFERVKAGLAQGYANLDWQVDKRGINLARADSQINAMLDSATSDVEAVLVFTKLVAAFDDPHLSLNPGPAPDSATLIPRQSAVDGPITASATCDAAHYRDGKWESRLPYVYAPDWSPKSDGPFVSGLIGDIGVVRIPSFDETRYLAACQRVARPGMDSQALRLATRAELNRQLTDVINTLQAHGISRLVVDVTGNGGGSEWSSEVAAMLVMGKLSRQAPRLAAPTCDRASVWKGERPCPVYGDAPTTETMQSKTVWPGRLAILVDKDSASATEELVTWLKSSPDTIVAGEHTFGAGCGYVDGGHAIAFKAAKIHLMVPNCSRYTAEGVNEIEGIEPTVRVNWSTVNAPDIPVIFNAIFARKK